VNRLGVIGVLVAVAAGAWLVWKTLGVAKADHQRARTDYHTRRTQHRLLLGLLAVLALGAGGAVFVFGVGGADAVKDTGPAESGRPESTSSCQRGATGQLTLLRTSPTTLAWTYIHNGDTEPSADARVTVRVDDQHAATKAGGSGILTVPDRPVGVHVEGTAGGLRRVYVTCRG
jgi:hypothetical protein